MKVPVLIVGAGPAGLMAACELARRGVGFRIVDKKNGPTALTNAAAVHARTLEIFGHVGIADRLVAQGQLWTSMTVCSQKNSELRIPMDRVDSSYGGSLLVSQSITEKALVRRLEELGGHVEWSTEVGNVEQEDRRVTTSLRSPSGKVETLESAWLIACDGLHSLVRDKVGIAVEGEDIESQYLVCDASLITAKDPREVVAFAGPSTILGVFPLGNGLYRVIGNLTDPDPKKAVDEAVIRRLIEARSYDEFAVESVKWSSPFWIHSKLARTLRSGRVFLAGDAGHVHSPAGGQGMNTGIQDVYNLAWKLALVIEGQAPETMLDSYEAERRPVIRSIVKSTEAVTKMALSKSRVLRVIRRSVMSWMNHQPRILEKIANRLTQLSLGYRKSPLLMSRNGVGKLRPGDRAPDVVWKDCRLYDKLGDRVHTVLVFRGVKPDPGIADRIKILSRRVQILFGKLTRVVLVDPDSPDREGVIADPEAQAHRRYGLVRGGLSLVRPDQYLSFLTDRWSTSAVERALGFATGREP